MLGRFPRTLSLALGANRKACGGSRLAISESDSLAVAAAISESGGNRASHALFYLYTSVYYLRSL